MSDVAQSRATSNRATQSRGLPPASGAASRVFETLAFLRTQLSPEEFYRLLGAADNELFPMLSPHGYRGCKTTARATIADFDAAYSTWKRTQFQTPRYAAEPLRAPPDTSVLRMWELAATDPLAAVWIAFSALVSDTVAKDLGYELDPERVTSRAALFSNVLTILAMGRGLRRAVGRGLRRAKKTGKSAAKGPAPAAGQSALKQRAAGATGRALVPKMKPKMNLTFEEMAKLADGIYRKSPRLQRLTAAHRLAEQWRAVLQSRNKFPPRSAMWLQHERVAISLNRRLQRELISILQEFQRSTGTTVRLVGTGQVEAKRPGSGEASLRSEPGKLQIEEQVFLDTEKLLKETTHELSAYAAWQYVGGLDKPLPGVGESDIKLNNVIVWTVEAGKPVQLSGSD